MVMTVNLKAAQARRGVPLSARSSAVSRGGGGFSLLNRTQAIRIRIHVMLTREQIIALFYILNMISMLTRKMIIFAMTKSLSIL